MKLFIIFALVSSSLAAPFLDDWRVSAGEKARVGQFPFTALITVGISVCSGSIIGQDTILTAAKCTIRQSPDRFTVYVGSVSRRDRKGATHKVRAIYQNPKYRSSITVNGEDIAVLKLSTIIHFDANCQPINLGSPSDVPAIGGRAFFAGYESSFNNELYWQQLNVTACFAQPKAVCLTRSPTSTEAGNTGGPSFVQHGKAFYQIGVSSGTEMFGSRLVASRVDQHAAFIHQYL